MLLFREAAAADQNQHCEPVSVRNTITAKVPEISGAGVYKTQEACDAAHYWAISFLGC